MQADVMVLGRERERGREKSTRGAARKTNNHSPFLSLRSLLHTFPHLLLIHHSPFPNPHAPFLPPIHSLLTYPPFFHSYLYSNNDLEVACRGPCCKRRSPLQDTPQPTQSHTTRSSPLNGYYPQNSSWNQYRHQHNSSSDYRCCCRSRQA